MPFVSFEGDVLKKIHRWEVVRHRRLAATCSYVLRCDIRYSKKKQVCFLHPTAYPPTHLQRAKALGARAGCPRHNTLLRNAKSTLYKVPCRVTCDKLKFKDACTANINGKWQINVNYNVFPDLRPFGEHAHTFITSHSQRFPEWSLVLIVWLSVFC